MGVVAVAGLVFVVATAGQRAPIVSRDAKLKQVDPLPGGLYSTPEQDALALKVNDAQARNALDHGRSYTPPIAPSQAVLPPPPQVEQAVPRAPEPHGTPAPPPRWTARPAVPEPLQAAFTVQAPPPAPAAQPAPHPMPRAVPILVAATTVDPTAEEVYSKQIGDLFSRWGGRAPRTDIVLPPSDQGSAANQADGPAPRGGSSPAASRPAASPVPVPVSARGAEAGTILVPAGRGVYAHPILAVNSDASSPIVLQADSGPIAGDRMIGTFAKQEDRLVIHVSTVIHNGENIGADGLVIAPDTMEAGVASNVDQHYLARFVLPAAAAFVAGLGQAIAQTTNTQTVLSPFGGAAYSTHLNINQQLGVAAGSAASQIGQTLNQAAPKGSTISLDANVAVGVMFLSNVTAHRAP
ncbi:MAG: hypothetical protein J0H14_07060 [Alphaproteobacteria bacterium]|nr:hypothetical protein [Alphaproteobacteria bacterium]